MEFDIFSALLIFASSSDDETEETINLEIGDVYEGGIVFHVNSTGEHGLAAAMGDLGIMNWHEAMDSESIDWFVPSISQSWIQDTTP